MIYWRIGLYTERSFWMFLILSNCHAFWDVKMLRLQKFTKPALQRQMLFPRCQAEWFDVFRCISYHFSFCFAIAVAQFVWRPWCLDAFADRLRTIVPVSLPRDFKDMSDICKTFPKSDRSWESKVFFWIQKGSRSYFFHFFLNFIVWKFGQDLREAVRKLEVDTVRAPNAGVTKSQKALSKGRERRFLACLRLFKASKF